MLRAATDSVLPPSMPANDVHDSARFFSSSSFDQYKASRHNGSVVLLESARISIALTKAFTAVNCGQGAASARARARTRTSGRDDRPEEGENFFETRVTDIRLVARCPGISVVRSISHAGEIASRLVVDGA